MSQQRRPLQDSGKHWLPSHTPEHHTVLPRRHERDHCARRLSITDIRHSQRRETGMRPRSHTLGDFFRCDAQARFRNSNRRHLSVRTRSDGKLFKISRLKAKTRVREVCLRAWQMMQQSQPTLRKSSSGSCSASPSSADLPTPKQT